MTEFNVTSTENSFESCDHSTFDKDYCPWTDDAFSDSDFEEDMVVPSVREEIIQNTEDSSDNNHNKNVEDRESEDTIEPDRINGVELTKEEESLVNEIAEDEINTDIDAFLRDSANGNTKAATNTIIRKDNRVMAIVAKAKREPFFPLNETP